MNIPNPPFELKELHENTWNFFQLLIQEFQKNLSNEGLVTPSQPTTNISQLTNSNNGTLVYDSTAHELKVNINGVFKVVNVT